MTCKHCGSENTSLLWAAMDTGDFDTWFCNTCQKMWTVHPA